MAWLLQMAPEHAHHRPHHRDEHCKPAHAFVPDFETREAARAQLMLPDGARDLAMQEHGAIEEPNAEPRDFV